MLPLIFPSLVRNVIHPIYRGFKRDGLLTYLEELEHCQWLSPAEIEDIQWRRLEDLLRQITTHVPYYRDLFRELGLRVDDIQNPTDFLKVPFLTKELIRGAGSRIITKDPMKKGYHTSTSGSTGEPLYFYVDDAAGPMRRANTARSYRWIGIDIGDRQAFIWGFPFDIPWKERLVSAVKNYFNNLVYLSSFRMSEKEMEKYAAKLKRYKPHLMLGYPSALTVFAEFCRERGVTGIYPRAVVSSGEKMYPHQREILETAYECPVFDRYGSNEFANVAQECVEHKGLHVFSDLMFVEVIHENGRPAQGGEVGELVITDLFNLYMPFVRYRTGDLAVPTDRICECGRGLPLLDRIDGRVFDNVVTPDNRSIGGYFWTYLSRAVPGIKQFQIEQKERAGVTFKIVPGTQWRNEYKQRLEKEIKENMGRDIYVNFAIVDEIPLSPAGKFKFIVSKVEERLVIKSKIHKANITGEISGKVDCIVVDEEVLNLSNITPFERVLIVDNTNGARIETFVMKGRKDSGEIIAAGAVSKHIHEGDEVIVMAFTWSEATREQFINILVDENNRFVRYLKEVAGDKI